MTMRVVIGYFPVLHKGYMNFLRSQSNLRSIFVIDSDLALQLEPTLRKDIRAIHSSDVARMLGSVFAKESLVSVINSAESLEADDQIIMPDEDISRAFVDSFLPKRKVQYKAVFLRWDKSKSLKRDEVAEDIQISEASFDKRVMHECRLEAEKSADWWRRVGGCIVKNGKVLVAPIHNIHVPNSNQPYYDGDPRSYFHRGEHIEMGTAMHVELGLIAKAAKMGVSLRGASLYVTTYPCPWCAKAIAYSGISKVYFESGYSVLDAQSILKNKNVTLIRVIN